MDHALYPHPRPVRTGLRPSSVLNPLSSLLSTLRKWASFVRFPHTAFALPFALAIVCECCVVNFPEFWMAMLAVVAQGASGRVYVAPDDEQLRTAQSAQASWGPDGALSTNARHSTPPSYGMTTFRDLFTPRQLVALTAFSDLVDQTRSRVFDDALASGDGIVGRRAKRIIFRRRARGIGFRLRIDQ